LARGTADRHDPSARRLPGRYELAIWHEQLKAASQAVTVTAGQSVPVSFAMQ
jgi:hypothetical protein